MQVGFGDNLPSYKSSQTSRAVLAMACSSRPLRCPGPDGTQANRRRWQRAFNTAPCVLRSALVAAARRGKGRSWFPAITAAGRFFSNEFRLVLSTKTTGWTGRLGRTICGYAPIRLRDEGQEIRLNCSAASSRVPRLAGAANLFGWNCPAPLRLSMNNDEENSTATESAESSPFMPKGPPKK